MLDWIKKKFLDKYTKSIVRTLVAALAGVLVGMGVDAETVAKFTEAANPVFTAAAVYAVAQLWSLLDKWQNQKE